MHTGPKADASEEPDGFKSGFVSLVGRPNTGKSTLLNAFIGRKIAITTSRPQTTRNRLTGIHNQPGAQVVFMDTPGIHKPHDKLGEFMVKTAVQSLEEVDCAIFVVEPFWPKPDRPESTQLGPGDRYIAEVLKAAGLPVILAINKVDTIKHADAILPVMEAYRELLDFVEIVPISAKTGQNVPLLMDMVIGLLPEGPKFYPDDILTDQIERFMAAEIVRERVMTHTRDEIPHSVAVEIEEFSEREGGNVGVFIRAVVYVERESQKRIIIGKSGSLLKKIGTEARVDIARLLDTSVYLDLWVKVKGDWRRDDRSLAEFGYRRKE